MYIVFVKLNHLGPTSCHRCKQRRLQIPEQAKLRLINAFGGGFWCKHFNTYLEAMTCANDWLRQLNADLHHRNGVHGHEGFDFNTENELNNPNDVGSPSRVWDEDLFTVTIAKEALN